MESKHHIMISASLAPIAILLTTDASTVNEFIYFYFLALAAGVFVDLDHFVVYRKKTGDWRDLRKALKNPIKVMKDHTTITVFSSKKKYIVHSFSFPIVAFVSYYIIPQAFGVVVSMLVAHLIADLYASYSKRNFPFHRF